MSFLLSSGAINVIPDSGNLQARYDARSLSLSDGDTVSTWPDESGNGNDLTVEAGSPTYINFNDVGLPAVDLDKSDILSAKFSSSFSPPWSVFFLGRTPTPNNSFKVFWADFPAPSNKLLGLGVKDDSFRWLQNGINDSDIGGTVGTSSFISSSFVESSTGTTRKNGSDVGAGSVDADALGGISVAGSDAGSDLEFIVTEILVYSVDESSNASSIESHLDRDTSLL